MSISLLPLLAAAAEEVIVFQAGQIRQFDGGSQQGLRNKVEVVPMFWVVGCGPRRYQKWAFDLTVWANSTAMSYFKLWPTFVLLERKAGRVL